MIHNLNNKHFNHPENNKNHDSQLRIESHQNI